MARSNGRLPALRIVCLVTLCALAQAIAWATTRGPDAGGYSATDAAVYSFVDLAGASGSAGILADTDDGTSALTLPFPFRFYGQDYTLLCVSSNGAAYFVTGVDACSGIVDFANTDLSATATPGDRPALLPFWSDLTFEAPGAGAVLYNTVGSPGSRRFVVQWNNAFPQDSQNPVTFQAILSESTHQVTFQYRDVDLGASDPASRGGEATIGIRNSGAVASNQQIAWSFNAPVIADESALFFSPLVGLTVIAPNGGELLIAGQPVVVSWSGGVGAASYDVAVSRNGGPFVPIHECTALPGSASSCTWTPTGPATRRARVLVTARLGGHDTLTDASDADFGITPRNPQISLLRPNPGSRWRIGATQTIRWSHNLAPGTPVVIEVSRDDGATWQVIAPSVNSGPGNARGQLAWVVTGPPTAHARIRVTSLETAATDVSGAFRID